MKCKHEKAEIKSQDDTSIDAFCPDCKQGWFGMKYSWRSSRGKLHKAPKWVQRLIPNYR